MERNEQDGQSSEADSNLDDEHVLSNDEAENVVGGEGEDSAANMDPSAKPKKKKKIVSAFGSWVH
ncbi:MAG: hypothetical protein WAS05_06310 [Candidatus Nanopelagicales bacterium]